MNKLTETIGQLRRAMPRNAAVQFLCDEAEWLQSEANALKRQDAVTVTNPIVTVTNPTPVTVTAPSDVPVTVTECPRCAAQRAKTKVRVKAWRAGKATKGR